MSSWRYDPIYMPPTRYRQVALRFADHWALWQAKQSVSLSPCSQDADGYLYVVPGTSPVEIVPAAYSNQDVRVHDDLVAEAKARLGEVYYDDGDKVSAKTKNQLHKKQALPAI